MTHIDRFDTSEYTTKFAGEVKDLNIESYVSKKNARRLDDVIKYIIVSGKQVGAGQDIVAQGRYSAWNNWQAVLMKWEKYGDPSCL